MATTNVKVDENAKDKEVEATKQVADQKKKKGKFYSKASKGSENTAAPPLPPRDPNSTGPKPTKLSTTATKPRNKPMFSDIDMMGFPGVAPYRRTNEFAIIPLCEKEYDVIATHHQQTASLKSSIYISRLSKSTSASDVSDYLKEKGVEYFNIDLLTQRYDTDFCSFKLTVSRSKLDTFLSRDFWPEGVKFRLFRESNIVKGNKNTQI